MAAVHPTPQQRHSPPPVPERSDSSSSSDSNLVGLIEPPVGFRSIIFKADPAEHAAVDDDPETPPYSRSVSPDGFDTDFDDSRLPALSRVRSAPGLGGEVRQKPEDQKRRSIAVGEAIPVSLEKIPAEHGEKTRRYVLKVDDELRELLAAGARERERHGSARNGRPAPRRGRFSDLVFTQNFTAFDRRNPESGRSPFHGFFVLMWLGVAILLIKIMAESYRSTGRIFGGDIVTIMFRPDHLFDCLLTDALLFFGNTLWCVPLQKAVLKGTFSWDVSGWILQAVWELVFLYLVISYTLYKEWPWIQTVFLVLHGLVILMKMHSYAFYNGYLSEVYKRRKALEEKLAQIKDAVASESTGTAESTGTELLQVEASLIYNRSRRRSSVGQLDISHLPTELSPRQLKQFSALVAAEIEACDAELSLEAANSPKATYPENLTYYNYLEYLHFPTVVYELNYPRSLSINWAYVAEKTAATFGVLGIMVVISQHFIYPVVMVANALHTLPVRDRLFEFPWILLKLVFPFMLEYLAVWYLIWELILNLLGELTRFSDRAFYGPWWNSTTWDGFARDWNKPVHNFLLRHVYHSSISTLQISREKATVMTFVISAVVHELVMWCIFGKLRGYLFCGQMLQLPLVALSRTRFMRGRETLGNVLFWVGIWTGPSFLSASYLIL